MKKIVREWDPLIEGFDRLKCRVYDDSSASVFMVAAGYMRGFTLPSEQLYMLLKGNPAEIFVAIMAISEERMEEMRCKKFISK